MTDSTHEALETVVRRLERKAFPAFGKSTICSRADLAVVLAAYRALSLLTTPGPTVDRGSVDRERVMRHALQDIAEAEPSPNGATAFEWCKILAKETLRRIRQPTASDEGPAR